MAILELAAMNVFSKRILRGLRIGAITGALLVTSATGQTIDEYNVKAAFLYNFAKFVVWPPQAFKSANEPIVICVLGVGPIVAPVEQAVTDKQIEGRPLVVSVLSDVKRPNLCHILFVGSAESKNLRAFAQQYNAMGVLTVGEVEGFAADGGVVNFKLENGRVHFEINKQAADLKGLKISSKLLSLAQIVKPGGAPR